MRKRKEFISRFRSIPPSISSFHLLLLKREREEESKEAGLDQKKKKMMEEGEEKKEIHCLQITARDLAKKEREREIYKSGK